MLFARRIATYLDAHPSYDLLNPSPSSNHGANQPHHPIIPLNIVLFRGSSSSPYSPSDPTSATRLTEAINATHSMYVTGTKWRGGGAIRLAVSNWRTGVPGQVGEDQWEVVRGVLEEVMAAKSE